MESMYCKIIVTGQSSKINFCSFSFMSKVESGMDHLNQKKNRKSKHHTFVKLARSHETIKQPTRSISLENLYREIGWLTLSDRRKYQKLVLTYKIFNGQTPNYLLDIFPPNVNARTHYTLRNANDIDLTAHRTELFASSFIPSAIKLWNELPVGIKSMQSLSSFKSYVMLSFSVSNVPKYYLAGDRKLSILHTRIRNNCSNLKFDLF